MNKSILFIAFLVLILTPSCYSQPKLEIEGGDTYSWGKIDPKGQPLTAKINFFNHGSDTLKIFEVKPGCGCTTAPLDKYNIEPGGFATLDVQLRVSSEGLVTKSITVRSNDALMPNRILTLKADITSAIGLSTPYIVFTGMELGKEKSSKITMRNNTKKEVKILSVTPEPKDFKVLLAPGTIIKPNEEVPLEVNLTIPRLENFSGVIKIVTDCKEKELLNVNVWAYPIQVNNETQTK